MGLLHTVLIHPIADAVPTNIFLALFLGVVWPGKRGRRGFPIWAQNRNRLAAPYILGRSQPHCDLGSRFGRRAQRQCHPDRILFERGLGAALNNQCCRHGIPGRPLPNNSCLRHQIERKLKKHKE